MSNRLYPIQKPDGLGGLEPYRYGTRDHIGVETDGETAQRGFNESLAWLRRIKDAAEQEHTLSGVHDTMKIPRAFIKATWDGAAYSIDSDSYLLGTSGSGIASVAIVSAGLLDVTLSSAMATTNYGIDGCPIYAIPPGGSAKVVRMQLDSVASTVKFRIRRYEGTEAATLALAHGDFSIVVNGDA